MLRKRGKLILRCIGPFEILEHVGEVAYRLALPPGHSKIHMVFHISMLRKYVPDFTHVLKAQPIHLRGDLTYEEQPIKIITRMEKMLRTNTIPLVKMLWQNHKIAEVTWERKDEMRAQYPSLFVNLGM